MIKGFLKKTVAFSLLSAFTFSSLLTGCKKAETDVSENTNVKIGVILDMSGERAQESKQMYDAVCMAVDEINAKGGVLTDNKQLEVVLKDDAGVELNAAGAYYQLVAEGASVVIGSNTKTAVKTLTGITYNSTVPLLMAGISSDSVVAASDFNFLPGLNDSYMAEAIADFAANKLECEGVGAIYLDQDELSAADYDAFTSAALKDKVNISYTASFADGKELEVVFEEIVAKKCDAVYLALMPEENLSMVYTAAKNAGYAGVFLGNEAYSSFGTEKDYILYAATDMANDNPQYDAFFEKYCKCYGYDRAKVCSYVRPAYEAVYYTAGAIEKAYTAVPANIMMKLVFLEGSTEFFGGYAIGAYGNTEKSVDIICLKGKKAEYVDTVFE